MLAAIDVGNTNITIGFFNEDTLIASYRLTTRMARTSDEFGMKIIDFLRITNITAEDIDDVIVSSVVPKVMYSFTNAIRKYLKKEPIIVGSETKTGITIHYDNPKSLGVDRIVAAAGAYSVYGGPILVIDFGTATTYDYINENGEFLGGVIAAGIEITAQTLSSQAAQLPEIALKKPDRILATNTIDGMQAGVVYGYIGQTEYIISTFKKEMKTDFKVVATGGLGRIIYNETELINVYDRNLIFTGLKYIYDKQKKASV